MHLADACSQASTWEGGGIHTETRDTMAKVRCFFSRKAAHVLHLV